MKAIFLFLVIAGLSFVACENNDSPINDNPNQTENGDMQLTESEQKLKEWEEKVAANPATAADIDEFIEKAKTGVVTGGFYLVQTDDYTIVDEYWEGDGLSYFLFEDGVARALLLTMPDWPDYTYVYKWAISQDNPLTLIFTDDNGTELRATLLTSDDERFYFEGVWPLLNDSVEPAFKRFVALIRVTERPREEVEALYEQIKAENEQK